MANRRRKNLVVDVRDGETEEEALKRSEGTPVPIDDLEITPAMPVPAYRPEQVAAAAADLSGFIAQGMDAQAAVDKVMRDHGVQVELREDAEAKSARVDVPPNVTYLPAKQSPGWVAEQVGRGAAWVEETKKDEVGTFEIRGNPAAYREVSVDAVSESPSNPRQTFEAMDELVASIKKNGILTPVLVVPSVEEGKPWRLVFGHRRLRAAKKAGLKFIPAIVHAPMTEAEVLEAQLIENCQRQDIAELEEGEAYARLIRDFGHTVDGIAAKVGKSRRTVYLRMQLVNLLPEARAALNQKKLSPSVALLVARVPKELQLKALNGIMQSQPDRELSVREASDFIQQSYMLRLVDSPFDLADDVLVPEAGSCKKCPKRTGNARDLFGDVGSADVCTDPPCHQTKVNAFWDDQKKRADSKGYKTLALSEGRRLYKTGKLAFDADYVERNAPCPEDTKRRTWKKLADWAGIEATVYLAGDLNGMPHELYKRSDLNEVLKALGAKTLTPPGEDPFALPTKATPTPEEKAKTQSEKKARELRQQVASEAMGLAVAAATKPALTPPQMRLAIQGLLHMLKPTAVLERRQLTEGALEKQVASKLTPPALNALMFELCTAEWIGDQFSGYSPELKALAKVFNLDLKRIERDAAAESELGLGKKKK